MMYKVFLFALLAGTIIAGGEGFQRHPTGSDDKAHPLERATQSFHPSVVVSFQPSGATYLRTAIRTAYDDLKAKSDAAEAAVPACQQTIRSKIQTGCSSCVTQQCEAKAASCGPNVLESIALLMTSVFNDAGSFVWNDVLHVEDISSTVEDFANGALSTATSAINHAAGTVWSGVQSAGDVLVDAGEDLLNAAGDIVDAAGNLVDNVGDAVGDAISDVGDAIGGIFGGGWGRRKRRVRSGPTCSELESQPQQACMKYADTTCYTDCDVTHLQTTYCTTYNSAVRALETSKRQHGWITNLPQQQDFIIRQVTVNSNNVNSAGSYTGAVVNVRIFGDDYTFTLNSAIHPLQGDEAGRKIAEQALNIFKSRHPHSK